MENTKFLVINTTSENVKSHEVKRLKRNRVYVNIETTEGRVFTFSEIVNIDGAFLTIEVNERTQSLVDDLLSAGIGELSPTPNEIKKACQEAVDSVDINVTEDNIAEELEKAQKAGDAIQIEKELTGGKASNVEEAISIALKHLNREEKEESKSPPKKEGNSLFGYALKATIIAGGGFLLYRAGKFLAGRIL